MHLQFRLIISAVCTIIMENFVLKYHFRPLLVDYSFMVIRAWQLCFNKFEPIITSKFRKTYIKKRHF